jgi:hypothetical protein
MYAELQSEGGRFLGTVYPAPSAYEDDTDAYVGGTIASGETVQGPALTSGNFEYTDLSATPATSEYSYYRSYVFTYVTDRGEESAPSAATEPIAVIPTQKVVLTIDVPNAPANAVAVRLYRTETTDSGTAFFYVDEIPIPPDPATYTDYTLSVDLPGDTLQTVNWYPPPADLKGLILSTKGFYAGYVGSQLFLSEPHIAYAWPTDYAIDFTGDIQHIARYGDTLAVFTDREIALIVGNAPLEVRKIKVEGFELLTSMFSTAEMDGLLYFASPTGIAAISGSNVAVITDDVISERYWRDNMNTPDIEVKAFDNALYLLAEPLGQAYRIGLQEDGGGFIKLSDANIKSVVTSATYQGVIMLPSTETDPYVFNEGSDVNRTVTWRGRVEVADIPMSPISVRVLAEEYPVTFRVFEGDAGVESLEIQLTRDNVRKIPILRRWREWSFEVEATGNVISLEVGTSGRAR